MRKRLYQISARVPRWGRLLLLGGMAGIIGGLAAAGWMALLVIGCLRADDAVLWAPVSGLVGVALLLVRQGWLTGRGRLVVGAGIGTGLGLALHARLRHAYCGLGHAVGLLLVLIARLVDL